MQDALAPLSQARRMLAEATTIDDILHIENLAQRAKDFAKAAGMGRLAANSAAKIMLDARRKAGETLAAMKERGELDSGNGGDRKSQSQPATVKIEDLGLTKSQSSRYQQEASVPDDTYEEWVARFMSDDSDGDMTASGLRKLAKQAKATDIESPGDTEALEGVVDSLTDLTAAGKKFGCIYADPPWAYGNQGTRAATNNHYPTMSVEAIAKEPVGELATDKSVLFLWTTAGFLRESFAIIDAWGFTYKSNMVWVKPQMGIGNYVRLSHEHLMIATRGGLRTNGKSQMSWVRADRTKHSRKPPEFRSIVEQLAAGPYLELYGREQRTGWVVYGNQISAARATP